jgi:hypothetical protein
MSAINFDLGNVLSGIGSTAKDIRSAITGKLEPGKEAEINLKIEELENQAMNAQTKINEIEAASPSFFKSGWRPACAWVCVISFTLQYFIRPILQYAFPQLSFPAIATGEMFPLLLGLLGLGTMRSVEKIKKV